VTEFRKYLDFAQSNLPPLGGTTKLIVPHVASFQVGPTFHVFFPRGIQIDDFACHLLLPSHFLP
jgi:hypothetical protein